MVLYIMEEQSTDLIHIRTTTGSYARFNFAMPPTMCAAKRLSLTCCKSVEVSGEFERTLSGNVSGAVFSASFGVSGAGSN